MFREAGPVRAISDPSETVPPPGAARLGLEDGDWLESVVRLMRESCLVVLRSGSTPGLIKELKAAVANIDPRRLLISFAPEITAANEIKCRTAYEQFRAAAGTIFPKPLPPWRPATLFAAFDADWSPVLLGKPGRWWYTNYRSGPRIMIREAVRERLAAQGISIRRKRADLSLGFYAFIVVTCITSSLMRNNLFPVRWFTLKPAGETFSVELPVNPKTVKPGPQSVLYIAEVPDAVYTVAIDPVPAGIGSSLDSIEPLLLGKEPKAERLVSQAISGGPGSGRQLAWAAGGKVIKLRFFVAGGKLYRLGIIGQNEYLDKPSRDTERFFGSFHAGASLVSQAGDRIELGGAVRRVVAEK